MERINLLYATTNKSKLHNMRYRLRNYPVAVLSPEDMHIHLDIDECGSTAIENALIKAREYFKVAQIPTLAGDCGLYLEGISPRTQPGIYVRRVNGKTLTDEEMIAYYSEIARTAKSPCNLHYFTGLALITNRKTVTEEVFNTPLILSAEPNTEMTHSGNPLDVITKTLDGRFYNTLSDVERASYDEVAERAFTEFVVNNLFY